jgi:hypothetical protein
MVLSFVDGAKVDPSLNCSSAFLDTASGMNFTGAGSAQSTGNLERLGRTLPKTAALMVIDHMRSSMSGSGIPPRSTKQVKHGGATIAAIARTINLPSACAGLRLPTDSTSPNSSPPLIWRSMARISSVGVMTPTDLYLSEYQRFIDSAAGIPGVKNLSIQTAGEPPPLSFVSNDYVDRALRHYPNVTLDAIVSPRSLRAFNLPGGLHNKHDKQYYDESFDGKDSFEGTPRRLKLRLSECSDSAKGRNMETAHNVLAHSTQARSSKEAIITLVSMFTGQRDPYRDVVIEPRGAQPTWLSDLFRRHDCHHL